MADVTHYAKARTILDTIPDGTKDAAALHAVLAVSTASREITGEVRNGLRNVETKLRDLPAAIAAGKSDAALVVFRGDAPVAINPRHVVAVTPLPDDEAISQTEITTTAGPFVVDKDYAYVLGQLGLSA